MSASDLRAPIDYCSRNRSRPAGEAVDRGRFRVMLPAFLMGLLAAQHVNIAGSLYVGEIFGVLLMMFVLLRRGRLSQTERRLLLFGALWALAQALSDMLNNTAVSVSLKGVGAPLVFVATIVGLSAYFRAQMSRMPSFLMGAALGSLVSIVSFPTAVFLTNPWKWGVGSAVLVIFTVYFSFFLRRKSLVLLLIGAAAFFAASVYYGARSLGFLPVLAVLAYLFFQTSKGTRSARRLDTKGSMVRLVPLIVVCLVIANVGATALFSSDYVLSKLPPQQAARNRAQARGDLGVLFGGRAELFASVSAFLDKPLLGHGTLAPDIGGYYTLKSVQTLDRLGYPRSGLPIDNNSVEIPTHSYLLQGLVWAGIFGGLFWIVLLGLVLNQFAKAVSWLPIYFYVGLLDFLWGLVFSPFPASARWATAVFLAAFFAATYMHRGRDSAQPQNGPVRGQSTPH